jgi:hypothetical protein
MADDGGVVDIFVYLGGQQEVPEDVTHVRIDRSVKIIPARAFVGHRSLVSVETHDGIEKIEDDAFEGCTSLRGIKLPGVVKVGDMAFTKIAEHKLPRCRRREKIGQIWVWNFFTQNSHLTSP